ncbi:hypothetical protein, partial [Streptomyces sp. NPDC005485]|uniref:hypothetical protein n=1 Tax=Streptomyces sp. NPDC005485 TaxID=3155591 RepID=UPI0033AE5D60
KDISKSFGAVRALRDVSLAPPRRGPLRLARRRGSMRRCAHLYGGLSLLPVGYAADRARR